MNQSYHANLPDRPAVLLQHADHGNHMLVWIPRGDQVKNPRFWMKEEAGIFKNAEHLGQNLWSVRPRTRFQQLAEALAKEFGHCHAYRDVRTSERHECTTQCQNAKSHPSECVCICAGKNHGGSDHAWFAVAGDFLVASSIPEYDRLYWLVQSPK